MLQFENYVPVDIVFGRKKIETLGTYVKKYGKKGLVVCTGPFFQENGLLSRIKGILEKEGIKSEFFLDVSPNPLVTEVEKGIAFARRTGCDVIIGLGGGSAIDAAKAIAYGLRNEGPMWPHWIGELPRTDRIAPMIAVTTTSGTGSHVTMFSVLTNPATHEKPGAGNEYSHPKVSIVDPELMLSLPKKTTASAGFDVIAHALEAFTSNSANPLTDLYCEQALRLAGKYLRRAVSDGSDIDAREKMALADTFAGLAIDAAVVTLCHAMAHAVAGVANTVHGETLAALTPHTMRFSMNSRPEKFRLIGVFLKGLDSSTQAVSLDDAVSEIEKLIKDIGLNIPLSGQGVRKDQVSTIVDGTLGYMKMCVELDARVPTPEEAEAILMRSI
jgi:alcohol dehydrogenase class IV